MEYQKPNSELKMKQIYIHFKQSMFRGKRNELIGGLSGEEEIPQRIHPVEAYIPISRDCLPPVAITYFNLVKQKGFVGKGNPILYVTANDTIEIKENETEERYNIVAHWPAINGHLQRVINDKSFIQLWFDYYTKPVNYETFEKLKKRCRIKDLTLDSDYNTCDLIKMIKNADWNAGLTLSIDRASPNSTLYIEIEYLFDKLILSNLRAELFESDISKEVLDRGLKSQAILRYIESLEERGYENKIQDYDKIVSDYFNGRIPLQSDLQGKSLERVVQEFLPNIIDSLVDFVEI